MLSLLYIFATESTPGRRIRYIPNVIFADLSFLTSSRLILKNLIIDTVLFGLFIVSGVLKIFDSLRFLPAIILFGVVCGSLILS